MNAAKTGYVLPLILGRGSTLGKLQNVLVGCA